MDFTGSHFEKEIILWGVQWYVAYPIAIERYNTDHQTAIVIRQSKFLNNIVEQDHRAIKRLGTEVGL